MFRSQLYDPLTDPERPEFYHGKSLRKNTLIFIQNSKFRNIFKSKLWQPIKSIFCRLLMISYSLLLIIEAFSLLGEKLILLNIFYLVLIIADGVVVIFKRKGLEDRWCCLSILYFICANSIPFWLLEINNGTFLSLNIHNPDFIHHIESHYKQLNDSKIVLKIVNLNEEERINSDVIWQESFSKDDISSMLEKHEALLCLTLILCRVFIPQATLTWGAISSLSEFSFNTILDIYSTINMCRDPRLNLPKSIGIAGVIISNGALLPIALNIFPDQESFDKLKISLLRNLTDNFYFRLIIQILFADLPFLILRLVILYNLKYVKKEMYYLIAKQVIIIFVKIMAMTYNLINNYVRLNKYQEINELNNFNL
ncbi:unnamed protein product [Brachionus calyciflorus]|uniref:Uncharacterized protein n=1 Tax=Brachionus calyciflorus TaxID=104777 RepID=A0A813PED5_9BILA|nr:unnamed protein product [Brachionus calyciflorus]